MKQFEHNRKNARVRKAQDCRKQKPVGNDLQIPEEKPLSMAEEQFARWLENMERLHLAEYVRYVDDRRRLFWSNFWSGIARGVGMAIGFTILGAILILILQDLARHNLPLIGELLDEIMNVVQNGMK